MYRWWTVSAWNDAGSWGLKVGPVSFACFVRSNGWPCFELHFNNRLLLAVPDWRVRGL